MCLNSGVSVTEAASTVVSDRGYLIAEVGSRDDGSGNPSFVKALCFADTHQCDTDGGYRGPRTSGHYGDEYANQTGGCQEVVGMNNLHAIIDEGRYDTADHPGAAQCTDGKQNQQGTGYTGDVVDNGVFEIMPGNTVEDRTDKYAGSGCYQQRNLASSAQCVSSERADSGKKHSCKEYDRDK